MKNDRPLVVKTGVSVVMDSRELYRNFIVLDRVRVSISFDPPPSNHSIEYASLTLFTRRSMAPKRDVHFVCAARHQLQIFVLRWEANDIRIGKVRVLFLRPLAWDICHSHRRCIFFERGT